MIVTAFANNRVSMLLSGYCHVLTIRFPGDIIMLFGRRSDGSRPSYLVAKLGLMSMKIHYWDPD